MKILASSLPFGANKMSQMQARYTDNKLKEAKVADIICHDMSDRDSVASASVMWKYLNSKGIDARVIISQKRPEALGLGNYDFKMIQASDDEELSKVTPDIAFCVDFGGEDRVLPNVLKHIQNSGKIMGFDHHRPVDILKDSFIQFQRPLEDDEYVVSRVSFYSDMTAKSTTSVIYRFFEALGEEIGNEEAYDLFLGLVDDSTKRGLLYCDGQKGEIAPNKKLLADKNAYEVYCKLREKLTPEQVSKIAKTVDIMSSLTKEQQDFKDSLKERCKFVQDKKTAYVEIKPDDSQ